MRKCISHYEFMHNPDLQPKLVSLIPTDIAMLIREEEVVDDRILPRTAVKYVNNKELFKGMKVQNYDLYGYFDSGAFSYLTPKRGELTDMDMIDKITNNLNI